MKNSILRLAAFLLLASSFFACKKETSFKDQLVGHWKSVKITIASDDVTNTYTYDLNLESSLEFNLDVITMVPAGPDSIPITQSYNGDWNEDENKQDITLHYSTGDHKTWDILEISENNITAENTSSDNKRYRVQFARQ